VSDFAQTGLISTLQWLGENPRLELELTELAEQRPIALVLPSLGGDLEEAAFGGIIHALSGATFLREIVVSVNAASESQLAAARARCAILTQTVTFLQTDDGEQSGPASGGKGQNVAAAVRHLAEQGECGIIATQDCDVTSFRRADLARLCYAVAHPDLGYRFAKMYYSRVTDRLYGRVSRLFLAPLLQAIVRLVGHQPLVDFLHSFRYPLAGEVALTLELATNLPLSAGWKLEIGQLCEVFRRVEPREICQVGGAAGYDHRHHSAEPSLAGMAAEIAAELLRQLELEGIGREPTFRSALNGAYRREATHALRRSLHLAQMNGLAFDDGEERAIIETFAAQL
jgi:glucosyl-3-phosphoglycerate synthase